MVARGRVWWGGKIGEGGRKEFPVMKKSFDVIYRIVTIANNSLLCILKSVGVDTESSHNKYVTELIEVNILW